MKKLGFGLMRLPLLDSEDPASIDLETLKKMVDSFLEQGFTYFDTAYMYHNYQSEIALREALVKRHPRDSFTVATKLPVMYLKSKEDRGKFFEEQLQKCGVDYFDYYMLHNLGVSHYQIAQKYDAFSFIEEKKREGKAKQIGFSFHDTAELLEQILTEHDEVDFVQLQINYLDWENESIQSRKCYEVAVKHNKPVIVMEPVKGGTLASLPINAQRLLKECRPNDSAVSWAIRYAASLPNVQMVLSGMSDMQQMKENTSTMRDFVPLNQKEQSTLSQVVEEIRSSIAVPCTSCRYCVEGCPKKIAIPNYFALYNTEKLMGSRGFSTQQVYYNNYIQNYGKASDCIGCKKCEASCPQHIPISDCLKEVAALFES